MPQNVITGHLLGTAGCTETPELPDVPGITGGEGLPIAGSPGVPPPGFAGHTGMQEGRAEAGGGVSGTK